MSVEIIQSLQQVPMHIDAVIELGKNLGVDSTRADIQASPYLLSQDSRINILAAGMLYGSLHEPDVILSGGDTVGHGYPTQPEAARTYLLRRFPDIPTDKLVLDESGFDTAASAEALGAIIRSAGYERVALVGVSYHVGNAARLFRNYGIPINAVVAAEGIVSERSDLFSAYVERWKQSDRIAKEIRRERIRGWLLHADPKGKLLRAATSGRVEKPEGKD